jgi:predicted MFS family arabinose efflux permease
VAGVPLGLLLANHLPSIGWRAPFFFIVLLSAMFFFIAYKLLPSLTSHMIRPAQGNIFKQIYAVAKVGNHLKAFAFISLLMMAGFTVVPYIALYTTSNLGLPESFLTIIYLCGGAATFFTSRIIGRMADKYGKQQAFIWITFASFIPLLITTHLVPVPWWVVLINSTVFFILVPGRMIPGMALVTAAASSQVRGTFMSLVSSVQMLSSGLASLIAGLIITRTASGQIEHFNIVGYIAVACGLLAIWLVRQLKVTLAEIAAPAPGKMPV